MSKIIPRGFDLQGPEPIDIRDVVDTIIDRDNIPDIKLYTGLKVYVKENDTLYILVGDPIEKTWEVMPIFKDGTHTIEQPGWLKIAKLNSNSGRGMYEIGAGFVSTKAASTTYIRIDIANNVLPNNIYSIFSTTSTSYITKIGLLDIDGDNRPYLLLYIDTFSTAPFLVRIRPITALARFSILNNEVTDATLAPIVERTIPLGMRWTGDLYVDGLVFSANSTITATPTTVFAEALAKSYTVQIVASEAWSHDSGALPSWVTVTSGSGPGDGELIFTTDENVGAERPGRIVVWLEADHNSHINIDITQAEAIVYTISTTPAELVLTPSSGSSEQVIVATSAPSWVIDPTNTSNELSLSPLSGVTGDTLTITIPENTSNIVENYNVRLNTETAVVYDTSIPISQERAAYLSVVPQTHAIAKAGGSVQSTVTTTAVDWEINSVPDPTNVSATKAGDKLNVTITSNPTSNVRNLILTVATLGITPKLYENVYFDQEAGDFFTVTPTTHAISKNGQTVHSSISTSAPSWLVSNISDTSKVSATKNGSNVDITVQNNTTTSSRAFTVTVSSSGITPTLSDVITLNQAAGDPPPDTLSISPTSRAHPVTYSTGTSTVTSSGAWSYDTSGAVGWFHVSNGSGSTGQDFEYSVDANNLSGLARSKVTRIWLSANHSKYKDFTATQPAPAKSLTISDADDIIPNTGGSGDTSVTSSSSWSYDPGTKPSWLTVDFGSGQSGDPFACTAGVNTGATQTANVKIWLDVDHSIFKIFTVTWAAVDSISLTPTTIDTSWRADNTKYCTVTASSAWEISNGLSYGTATKNGNRLEFSISQNSGAARSDTVTIRLVSNTTKTAQVSVNQAKFEDMVSLDPQSYAAQPGGDMVNTIVTSSRSWIAEDLTWSGGGSAWLSLVNASGNSGDYCTLNVTQNNGTTNRSATVRVKISADQSVYQIFTITQGY